MQPILDFLGSILSDVQVKVIVAHTLINLAVALAAALVTKKLDLARIADFLTAKLLPFVVVYAAARIVGDAAGLAGLAMIAFAAIEAALLKDLTDSLAQIGLPMPTFLKKPSPVTEDVRILPLAKRR